MEVVGTIHDAGIAKVALVTKLRDGNAEPISLENADGDDGDR